MFSKLVESRSSKEMTNFTEEGRYDNTFAIAPPRDEDKKKFSRKKKFFDTKFLLRREKRAKSSFFSTPFSNRLFN
jgi:hypothetical protein